MPRIDQKLFYTNTVAKHGKNAKGVAWNDEKRQRRRFDALLKQIPDIASCSVVDAGCGFGDLYLYMQQSGRLPKRYIGLDMMEPMVQEAQRRTGQSILRRDLLTDPLPEADWYLVSGSFNLLTRFETLLAVKRCFDAADRGIVFNLLRGSDRSGTYNYWLPKEMEKACRNLGKVRIYEGYLEGDFTVKIKV
ncbi:class I SAM-dependent methyltransferase [Hydrogenimonas urashimensis]|uniref:class I SAM-dependent methyltransferase n=1 Tax=Hydrogenimonas urashimensis TaxID=2740515 RepID=UPI0019150881|nr:class I SAM-dependent methyltransferase [Hydrogenimonas urashimensis]